MISDTGPINYLVLIGHIDLLPELFAKVILPAAVQSELTSRRAPSAIRRWAESAPVWIEILDEPEPQFDDALLKGIDSGEKAAILSAIATQADLLLMDDRRGVRAAERLGLNVTGTLGVLDLAAHRGLIDFKEAVRLLRGTNFRIPEVLVDTLLKKHL